MPRFYKDQEELADGLAIYTNPPKNGSSDKLWWYVRIRLLNEKSYIRKSLRTTNKPEAKRLAYKLYEEVRKDEYYGFVPNQIKLADLVVHYLRTKASLSKNRTQSIERVSRLYLVPYFGDLRINDLASNRAKLEGYLQWRLGYWERYKERIKTDPVLADRHRRVNEDGYGGLFDNERRTPINIAETPSRNTLILEYGLYNALMNFAVQQKYIPDFLPMNQKGLPNEEPKYQARYTFSEAEIKKIRDALVDELRSDREAVWDDDTGLQIRDEYGEPLWETFVSNPHIRRCRHNLRGLVLLMLTTGMRVQECLDLRWKHISEGVTNDVYGGNFRFLTIRVKEKKSRRQMLGFRTVYVPYHMKKVLGRLKPINTPDIELEDYVFSKVGGKRYGLLMRRFNQLIRKLGIYESPEGAKRTLTHLRSYYASEQLQHQPLAVVAAQMGHTIQTLYDFYTQIAVGKRAYDILKHIEQPRNIIEMANARHLADEQKR